MTRMQAVLIGGAFGGVLSALPFVSACCCLWLIGGGAITAWLMQQGQAEPLGLGQGALGGLLAGVAAAVIGALVSIPIQLLGGALTRGADMFGAGDANVPPEMREFVQMIEQMAANPALIIGFGFLLMLFFGPAFSALGGLLGAFFFRKDGPPAPAAGASDVVPPPPPLGGVGS